MSYKVKYRGSIDIECETVEDVIAIAERLASKEPGAINTVAREQERIPSGQAKSLEAARFRELLSHLSETQKRLLQSLVEHPHGKTDRVLRQLFNLGDNKALGGMLAGISKRSRRIGTDVEALFSIVDGEIGGERVKEYRPTEGLRQVAREMGWDVK